MSFVFKLAIVILIVAALAEYAPELVNAILILVLLGMVLGNWKSFSGIASVFGSLGK